MVQTVSLGHCVGVCVMKVMWAAGDAYTAARVLDGGGGRGDGVNCDEAKWVQCCTDRVSTADRVLVFCF